MNILNPPPLYVKFRSMTHNKEGADFRYWRGEFYKAHEEAENDIKAVFDYLHYARHACILPIEKVEVFEADGKKHGRVESMMVYDIEYWREGGRTRSRKVYVPAPSILSNKIVSDWRKPVDLKPVVEPDPEPEPPQAEPMLPGMEDEELPF